MSLNCNSLWRVPLRVSWYQSFHIHKWQKLNLYYSQLLPHALLQSFVEEHSLTILYHPGKKNANADNFPHLPLWVVLLIPERENASVVLYNFVRNGCNVSDDLDIFECFLNLPSPEVSANKPLTSTGSMSNKTSVMKSPPKQPNILLDTLVKSLYPIVCFASPHNLKQWKIAITKSMITSLIQWYHTMLAHLWQNHSQMTIQSRYSPDNWRFFDYFHCIHYQQT